MYKHRFKFYKNVLTVCLMLFFAAMLSAQLVIFPEDDDYKEDYVQYKKEKKSAITAILMSTVFPGSGHFYSNKNTVGTYVFPIIEIALWGGYFYYNSKGDDIEKDYMKYADKYYDRTAQHNIEARLINHESSSQIYKANHFRLDDGNTQHFYEDIAKYNKYVFGWDDWAEVYMYDGEIKWVFSNEGIWLGNIPTNPDYSYPDPNIYDKPYSKYRQEYINMRRDAQENYDLRTAMTFGFVINRLVSVLDVVRVTNKYNRELRYTSNYEMGIFPIIVNNQLTPTINVSAKF